MQKFDGQRFSHKAHINTVEGGSLLFHLPPNCSDAGKTGPSPLLLRYCGNHHHAAPANANYHIPQKTALYNDHLPNAQFTHTHRERETKYATVETREENSLNDEPIVC